MANNKNPIRQTRRLVAVGITLALAGSLLQALMFAGGLSQKEIYALLFIQQVEFVILAAAFLMAFRGEANNSEGPK